MSDLKGKMKTKEVELNKSVLNRLYRAEAFLENALRASGDFEYVKIMTKAAKEEIQEALAVPGFWY